MVVQYRIEVYDTRGRRTAVFTRVPLLEVVRSTPDKADRIRGLLPAGVVELGHGYLVRVWVEGALFCKGYVTRVRPEWSDARKLILDRYVSFHEVIEFEAERPALDGNTTVSRAYTHRDIAAIVKSLINTAPGSVHYHVDHAAYPDGAEREYGKFLSRKTPENQLQIGGIATGQWVGADRINAAAAYAKDGDTITGIEVDGELWPDLRLMMIDCEETARNSHAIARHPEVAHWTDQQYAASRYALRAKAAKAALQNLLETEDIGFIELNPHRDASGSFDDRVDAYGRYIGLVYGGGKCFNAAMVELGHADVYLYQDGRFHVPEMELKDFFSYVAPNANSVETTGVALSQLDFTGGLFEALTALAYAADGFVWSVEPDLAVTFRRASSPDRVLFFHPVDIGVALGSDSTELVNTVFFSGNPLLNAVTKTYVRQASATEFGTRPKELTLFGVSLEDDADKLVEGFLDDVAYPEPSGAVRFFRGDASVRVGDLLEVRGNALRRLEQKVAGQWADRFHNKLVGRAAQVTHRFYGKRVSTDVTFTSPLRSVQSPLSVMLRTRTKAAAFYQFRLDDAAVGVDMDYRLD